MMMKFATVFENKIETQFPITKLLKHKRLDMEWLDLEPQCFTWNWHRLRFLATLISLSSSLSFIC